MNPANFNAAVGVALQHEMKHNKGKPKDASKSSSTSQNQSTSNQQNQAGKNSCKNSNDSKSSTPKAQNAQANANKNGKCKAQESTPLTPDEKVAKGVLEGRLSPEEIASYAKDGRCFRCHAKGHLKKDCPKLDTESSTSKSTPSSNVLAPSPQKPLSNDQDESLIQFYGHVNGHCILVLFDPGSMHDLVNKSLVA